jgi:hypothetical protein
MVLRRSRSNIFGNQGHEQATKIDLAKEMEMEW